MTNLQHTFPLLPTLDNRFWANDVLEAHQTLLSGFTNAAQLLQLEDGDPIRLRIHSERLYHRLLPILRVLENEGMDGSWIREAAEAMAQLIADLESTATTIEEKPQPELHKIQIVSNSHSGSAGRPSKVIDENWLSEANAPHRRLTYTAMSKMLGVHRNTLRKKLKESGSQPRYAGLTDPDLDNILREFCNEKNTSGCRYADAYLRAKGLRVQRNRIRLSLRRVRGITSVLRNHRAIDRRKYTVPRSNYLWHCDGHHKLIRWGIVIHGIVDGYCRTITGLRASNNNLADTVLDVFEDAIGEFGLPSRVRGDRGGENVKLSVYMIRKRGPNRASFMWGSSTRNTRIERLWVEVGTQFARRWRAFFTMLERIHKLDISDAGHLWLLHFLFLSQVNGDCTAFKTEWNLHPISGGDMHDKSPADRRFISVSTHGTDDHLVTESPALLNKYLGTHGLAFRRNGLSGAGHPRDEEPDSDQDEDLSESDSDTQSGDSSTSDTDTSDPSDDEEDIARSQNRHIRHEPIKVPTDRCPFKTDEDIAVFLEALNKLREQEVIPAGFGVLESEWDADGYPEIEAIRMGRAGRELQVSLSFDIWWPRAVEWVQGLYVMSKFMIENEL